MNTVYALRRLLEKGGRTTLSEAFKGLERQALRACSYLGGCIVLAVLLNTLHCVSPFRIREGMGVVFSSALRPPPSL